MTSDPYKYEVCANCKFFEEGAKECRKLPPKAYTRNGVTFTTYWPEVSGLDWCGSFRAQETPVVVRKVA